ncbi:DUF6279 family lipoprotein [Bdellovibrio bacteriovorus]|uniref:Putative lipoprotein n=1 Tax=Bdellovibrio bacteriovorus (strain ATCC 15356 / DSM 50701 / NCIMB 9529 / HD100) TaxID=264462 RepID=Q6MI26_BDEBA|nr:DUF6279 family lipoprotein [Bdellovibrio bacteriovorus]CAE78156.1 putative lipoprotein [Bdellovibrio bacteriovorus HD100]
MNRFLCVVLCAGAFILTGCNHFGFAFKWADTYIASKVDDYFDISSSQSRHLKDGVQKDLGEIKSAVLPQWIARLKGLQQEVQKGALNASRTSFYFDLFLKDVEQINARFADTAGRFIASTQPRQLTAFAREFAKKTQDDLNKFHQTSKYRKEMRNKYTDHFEMFLGSLTAQQKKMIEAHLDSSPFPGELKARNKAHILSLYLQQMTTPEAKREFLKTYYDNPAAMDLPEYQTAFNEYKQQLQKLIIEVLGCMDLKQKKNLIENLNEKTAQLEKIAKAG